MSSWHSNKQNEADGTNLLIKAVNQALQEPRLGLSYFSSGALLLQDGMYVSAKICWEKHGREDTQILLKRGREIPRFPQAPSAAWYVPACTCFFLLVV